MGINLLGEIFRVGILALLLSTANATNRSAIFSVKNGWLWNPGALSSHSAADSTGTLPIIHLEGIRSDAANAHGELLNKTGFVAKYGHIDTVTLKNWLYRFLFRPRLQEYLPESYEDALQDFAEKIQQPQSIVFDQYFENDRIRLLSLCDQQSVQPEAAAVWDSGRTTAIHGMIVPAALRSQLGIFHYVPANKNELASIAVGFLSTPLLSIFGFNESGLSVSLLRDCENSSQTQSRATAIGVFVSEMLNKAKSIDDAITILKGMPRTGTYTFLVNRDHDRAEIRITPKEVVARRSSERLTATPSRAQRQLTSNSPASWGTTHELQILFDGIRQETDAISIIASPTRRLLTIRLSRLSPAYEFGWSKLHTAQKPRIKKLPF